MNSCVLPGGWRLRRYDRLGSTSDLCLELAAAGEPDGLAVLAEAQTAGRGSRGRAWESAPGNLCLSVLLRPRLLRPEGDAAEAGCYSLLAGVAVWEALAAFLPRPDSLLLKWPNDVLLAGRKLAGVLIESATRGDGELAWLVIGVGANLATAPIVAGRATACLADAGVTPPPAERIARMVLERLAHWRCVRESDGFAPIRSAWLAHAHALGAPLVVGGGTRLRAGRFAGLTEGGALLLATEAGTETFPAGEVLQEVGELSCSS